MNKVHLIFYAVWIISFGDRIAGDYYTSVVGLDTLLTVESLLVEYFDHYFAQAEETAVDVETVFEEVEQNLIDSYENLDTALQFYDNPINAFKAIRRLAADWPKIFDGAQSVNAEKDLNECIVDLENQYTKPTTDDLNGAVKGLLRLQRTYALNTEDIASGVLNKRKVSSELSASDCFEIGRYLTELKKFNFAAEWLIQAKIRLSQEQISHKNESHWFGNTTDLKILENLSPVMNVLGQHKLAAKFNEELLSLDPNNKMGLENQHIYLANLMNERRKFDIEGLIDAETTDNKENVKLNKTDLYEKTCRGELRRAPKEERKYHCRYAHRNIPFCFIAPFKMEELSFDPPISVFYDTIYDVEIEKIINFANDTVERSKVGDVRKSEFSDIRTSKNTWLWFHQNSFMNNLATRLTDITGLSLDSAEALQVANYGIGGHYGPHHDFTEGMSSVNFGDRGNRILTALFYINDVEMGGGTAFPYLHIMVPPIKRSLLVWFNMHESLDVDYRTLHAGCPVLKGSKWICNEWFHESGQEFRRPCSLQQLGNRSIEYKDMI